MPWNGSGVFSRTDGTRNGASVWTQAKAALVRIVAVDHDTHDQDLASGINNCLARDGQNRPLASIDWNGQKITGLAAGTSSGDALHAGQMGEGMELVSGLFRAKLDGTTLKRSSGGLAVNVGEGLEDGEGTCRVKLADATITRSEDGLAVNSAALSLFTTGDVKPTFKVAADAGWVMMDDGSIGDASSEATTRAHADAEALFTLLWDNIPDAHCVVTGGRGASASADFAAHKTLALPKVLGRALASAGSGSDLTARGLGEVLGAETHALTVAEMPAHSHVMPTTTTARYDAGFAGFRQGGTMNGATESAGGDGMHNNMQPTLFLNVMIKL
ncbi:MAG TPA: hypothetical protein DCW68_07325 [Rhodospirillaceae bacterium]|nr:MAG: hypothetical protein A2018_06830 [Alphaproteobacteria bacterium GWF2_58_20]HAU29897.1 hypothetical protein [Rhodospirillaceae bacterium]